MKKYMKPELVLIMQPENALMLKHSDDEWGDAKKRQELLPMEDDFDSLPSWEDMSEEYKGQNLWDD